MMIFWMLWIGVRDVFYIFVNTFIIYIKEQCFVSFYFRSDRVQRAFCFFVSMEEIFPHVLGKMKNEFVFCFLLATRLRTKKTIKMC